MKMTSERAQQYHDWLRKKVREWQAEYERAVDAEVRTGHIHTTRARADCYAYALGKFVELAGEPETTEPLHEMAGRLCRGRECNDCPANVGYNCVIAELMNAGVYAYEQLAALRRWAAENPLKPAVKTYKDDFYEKFPDAPRTRDGFPRVLIGNIYTISEAMEEEYRDTTYPADWDRPLGYWEAE